MKATIYKQYKNGKPVKKPVGISGNLETLAISGGVYLVGKAFMQHVQLVSITDTQLVLSGIEDADDESQVYQEWVCVLDS